MRSKKIVPLKLEMELLSHYPPHVIVENDFHSESQTDIVRKRLQCARGKPRKIAKLISESPGCAREEKKGREREKENREREREGERQH